MTHFKEVCRSCGTVLGGCRCFGEKKEIRYGLCVRCKILLTKDNVDPETDLDKEPELKCSAVPGMSTHDNIYTCPTHGQAWGCVQRVIDLKGERTLCREKIFAHGRCETHYRRFVTGLAARIQYYKEQLSKHEEILAKCEEEIKKQG